MQLKDDGGKALVADIPSRESCTPTAYVLKCLAACLTLNKLVQDCMN